MQTITTDYLDALEHVPKQETLDMETDALRSFYRYEDQMAETKFAALEKARDWQPNTMLMYFEPDPDRRTGRFVNPLDVEPAFDKAPAVCRLDLELNALHVDELISRMKLSVDQPLEHRLSVQAPMTMGAHRDWTSWILCSAINVFLQKDQEGRNKTLQTFVDGVAPSRELARQEAIQIEKGRIKLSHGLWGHTRKNVFLRIFEPLTKLLDSPLIAAAGLPAMVPTVAKFAFKNLKDYTEQDKVRDLWQTKTMDFRISGDAQGMFTLRPGYWTVIDADYVKKHPDLDGHKIDFEFATFEIVDKNDKSIDAAYVVNKIQLEPQETPDPIN